MMVAGGILLFKRIQPEIVTQPDWLNFLVQIAGLTTTMVTMYLLVFLALEFLSMIAGSLIGFVWGFLGKSVMSQAFLMEKYFGGMALLTPLLYLVVRSLWVGQTVSQPFQYLLEIGDRSLGVLGNLGAYVCLPLLILFWLVNYFFPLVLRDVRAFIRWVQIGIEDKQEEIHQPRDQTPAEGANNQQ